MRMLMADAIPFDLEAFLAELERDIDRPTVIEPDSP